MADSPDEQWSIRWPVQVTDLRGGAISAVTSTCAPPGDGHPALSRGESGGNVKRQLRPAAMRKARSCLVSCSLRADIDGNFMPFEMQPFQLTMNFSGTRSTLPVSCEHK